MFCIFVLSTFLLFRFNIVCELHNYLIENEHDMLSVIIRPIIHAIAQLSSEKIGNLPSEPMSVVFIILIVTFDLLMTSNCKTITQKWIAHNKFTLKSGR